MNELSLMANELHEQAIADFRVSERFAYSFIMKVKRIRDDRLYKELGFGTFDDYCDKAWNTVRRSMDERIQIAESFGQANFESTYSQIGHSKSLLLARLEPETRKQVESTIDVRDATVKDLTLKIKKIDSAKTEAERQAKEATERAARAEQDALHWQGVARSANNKPPRIETKTVEVVPEHVKKDLADKDFQIRNLRAGYQEAKEKLQSYELRSVDEFDEESARKEREKLQHEADTNTIKVRIAFKTFIEQAAVTGYIHGAIACASQSEKDRLAEMADAAQKIIDQTKLALRGRKLGVVNE